jgi:DNA polymerase (family 10)
MQNAQVSAALNEVADLLEMSGENVFRIRAYRRAAETIAGLGEPVDQVLARDPHGVSGIGAGIGDHIRELLTTGSIQLVDELHQQFPPGVVALLQVPGVGPKMAARVYQELGVAGIDELEAAARDGRLASVSRVGPKTAESILRNIEAFKQRTGRTPIGVARPLAQSIIAALEAGGHVQRLTAAGSLRRFQETVGDLDLVGVSDSPESVMDLLVSLPQVARVLGHGRTKTSVVLTAGLQLDLRLVEPRDYGSLLQHFTGNQQHNILLREYAVARGLKISEYGIATVATGETAHFEDEESLYAYLKLQYIPPELRQGQDEVRLAARHALPRLVALCDLRGDLHVHTNWSDGTASIEEMVQAAQALGYAYVAISDHSGGRGVANGLSIERLRAQIGEVRAVAARYPAIQVFTASEVDIRADGSMDYPDEVLAELDLVIGSVHSAMGQPADVTTARLLRAIENPHVDLIGHLTTRLIESRPGIEFDRAAVFAAAARTGAALEVNASPSRLDLRDTDVRLALAAGAKLTIDTDAHAPDGLSLIDYGVGTARRGGARREDVWNTAEPDQLLDWLRRHR